MIQYYFCEQCETYHHPNRIINGEVLAACECEVQTQEGLNNNFRTTAKPRQRQILPDNNQKVIFSYQSTPVKNEIEKAQGGNLPFQNIVLQENKKALQKIIHSPPIQPSIKTSQAKFKHTINTTPVKINSKQSLNRVRSEQMIRKPHSPKTFIPQPLNVEVTQPVVHKVSPSSYTPIQTMKKITDTPLIPLMQGREIRKPLQIEKTQNLSYSPLTFEDNQEKQCCYKCCYF